MFEVIIRSDLDVDTIRARMEARLGPGTVRPRATRWDTAFGSMTVASSRGRTVIRLWNEEHQAAYARLQGSCR